MDKFDEAMVERLAIVFSDAEDESVGFEVHCWPRESPKLQESYFAGIRAVLTALSQDYVIVPRTRLEGFRHAINSYAAFNCEGAEGDCGRLTYMAGEYLKLIAELEATPHV